MKKLLFSSFLLFTSLSFSQTNFGIYAGLNNSALSNSTSSFYMNHKPAIHIGAVAEKDLSKKISFRPGLEYSQHGNRDFNSSTINYKLDYLSLPLNFKFFDSPYLLFGPRLGFLLSEEIAEYRGEPDSFDYGLNLGIGLDIQSFFLELKAYQGFNKLFETEIDNMNFEPTNTVLQLSLGYHF